MKPVIVEVTSRKQLKQFVHFENELYKGNPYYTPCLESDEVATLDPAQNAAYEFCKCRCWLALDAGGKIVGRVAGIINPKANAKWNKDSVRFGWIDFIEDFDVVKALIDTVAHWGREEGLSHMVGPLGFADMDKEGLLVEGFDRIAPFTTIYNYEYYGPLLEKVGLEKDIDWVQRSVSMPDDQAKIDKIYQAADLVEKRFGLHVVKEKNVKKTIDRYAMRLFHMYNESFAPLYEFTPLTDRQIEGYIKSFSSIMDADFLAVLVDKNDDIKGFAICSPSPAKAFQKNGGKLFPFGWIPVLKALRGRNDTLEAFMIGVHPDSQNKGAFAPMFKFIHQNCVKRGIKTILNNPQLENNFKVMNIFEFLDPQFYMRRRSYKMEL